MLQIAMQPCELEVGQDGIVRLNFVPSHYKTHRPLFILSLGRGPRMAFSLCLRVAFGSVRHPPSRLSRCRHQTHAWTTSCHMDWTSGKLPHDEAKLRPSQGRRTGHGAWGPPRWMMDATTCPVVQCPAIPRPKIPYRHIHSGGMSRLKEFNTGRGRGG